MSATGRRSAGVVVAWMPTSTRSRTLADRLGFELVLLARRGFMRPWTALATYPRLILQTIVHILRRRPRGIVVVAPPFVLPLVALVLARMLGARLVIDIHSGALLDRRWRWSVPLLRWVCRQSDGCVVTVVSLSRYLKGARVVVVPDVMANTPLGDCGKPEPRTVVAICGWASDEPLETLVESAAGQPWTLLLTGRPRRRLAHGPNVRIAGFLDHETYWATLCRASAIVVLTTREETLLAGAWEAVASARPLVVSGTQALRATFGPDVVYTDPSRDAIAEAVNEVLADPDREKAAERRRDRWRAHSDSSIEQIRSVLGMNSEH